MLMADGFSDFWDTGEFGSLGEDDHNNENLCVTFDELFSSMDDSPNHDQKSVCLSPTDVSASESVPNGGKYHEFRHQIDGSYSGVVGIHDDGSSMTLADHERPGQFELMDPAVASKERCMENPNSCFGRHDFSTSLNDNGAKGNDFFAPVDTFFSDMSRQDLPSRGSFFSQGFDRTLAGDISYFADSQDHLHFTSSGYSFFPMSGGESTDIKEVGRFENGIAYPPINSRDAPWGGRDELAMDNSGFMGYEYKCKDNNHISSVSDNYSYTLDLKPPTQPLMRTPSNMTCTNKIKSEEDGKHNLGFPRSVFSGYSGVMDGDMNGEYTHNADEKTIRDLEEHQSQVSISFLGQNHGFHGDNMAGQADFVDDIADGVTCRSSFNEKHPNGIKSEISGTSVLTNCITSHPPNISQESTQSNSVDYRSNVDDDSDICIIEEMSHPAPSNPSDLLGRPSASELLTSVSETHLVSGFGGTRLKSEAERLIYRVALRDLSQPKSEDVPPDGSLAVSLLRHQRIALSWMVKKETGIYCSGGILADDQGLGKTISTIALLLKERSPINHRQEFVKQGERQTLNLDEDDDDKVSKKPRADGLTSETTVKTGTPIVQRKGRPAAGTLIVCPTSVLRQWAEEIRNKVAPEARLSVLVYHGGNRTKDPFELANYDVVLTTYSIVSMEVPKQPLVDKDNDGQGKLDDRDLPPSGLSNSKKRKHPSSSDKKKPKNRKELGGALLESTAGPLAKVQWFRVVLDEAQSIKNHRTQVARACWGLRAKRRWCLSGTPIQNAIDDLYSYFRFLRYYPYDVYNTFCSDIKAPIQRSPGKGYKRLQAILKTVMLRRTKGTILDGEPIIKLPPKFVELRKVEFSKEERDFYTRLEADSRAQFEEYAAAGTVKENYVNILLMLLRLRQACDHPLLVNGYDSSSLWKSSIEMAKKLPREKQKYLLSCLEASLAICSICNDPPEEAVVSICGHVFCNQCMCEHLTGEDSHCPATGCKARINTSQVFSKSSLTSCLSEHPCSDSSLENSDSESLAAVNQLYSSSKIKAALEVLQSLSKPQDCTSRNGPVCNSLEGSADCTENFSAPSASPRCISAERNLVLLKPLNDSTRLVGEKAIVFSQWTRMLDLLEACLKESKINYRRLDGTMTVVARDKAVKDFNTLPEVSVMIMSLKAASLGLNMVSACHVLLLDLWWNPTTEDQAVDRAHRIGQTRPVTVLRLTVKDTVEDRILALQEKKRVMVASAFGEDEKGGRQTRLTVDDLTYLFRV